MDNYIVCENVSGENVLVCSNNEVYISNPLSGVMCSIWRRFQTLEKKREGIIIRKIYACM